MYIHGASPEHLLRAWGARQQVPLNKNLATFITRQRGLAVPLLFVREGSQEHSAEHSANHRTNCSQGPGSVLLTSDCCLLPSS